MSGAIKAARGSYMGDAGYAPAMPGTGYAGDPGLFGFLKKVAGKVAGVGALVGVPGAGIARKFLGGGAKRKAFGRKSTTGCPPGMRDFGRGCELSVSSATGPQPVSGPFSGGRMPLPFTGRTGTGGPGQTPGPSFVPAEGCPVGHHPNKTGYWVTSSLGTPSYVSPGERCVKNRKRNPLNPRANDRAISRLSSAKRAAQTLGRITIRAKC